VNVALAVIAGVAVAGAVLAVSARDVRATVLGVLVVLLATPLVASPWPGPLAILARVAAALLAARLLTIGLRGEDVTGGTRIGWPAEALAKFLGVPEVIVSKPASADLIEGQTDEGDFGISYADADAILNWLLSGYNPASLVARGFDPDKVELVRKRLAGTHWKRKLPTVALLSSTGIGESYLRPVDY